MFGQFCGFLQSLPRCVGGWWPKWPLPQDHPLWWNVRGSCPSCPKTDFTPLWRSFRTVSVRSAPRVVAGIFLSISSLALLCPFARPFHQPLILFPLVGSGQSGPKCLDFFRLHPHRGRVELPGNVSGVWPKEVIKLTAEHAVLCDFNPGPPPTDVRATRVRAVFRQR